MTWQRYTKAVIRHYYRDEDSLVKLCQYLFLPMFIMSGCKSPIELIKMVTTFSESPIVNIIVPFLVVACMHSSYIHWAIILRKYYRQFKAVRHKIINDERYK